MAAPREWTGHCRPREDVWGKRNGTRNDVVDWNVAVEIGMEDRMEADQDTDVYITELRALVHGGPVSQYSHGHHRL